LENFGPLKALFLEMPRNAPCVAPGLAYHVTQRGSNRQRVFFSSSDYRMYLNLLRQQLEDARAAMTASAT